MPIPTSHLLGGVTREFIDDSLVYTLAREVTDEAVSQTVPSLDFLPLAAAEHSLEMIIGLMWGESRGWFTFTADHAVGMTEGIRTAGVAAVDPGLDDGYKL